MANEEDKKKEEEETIEQRVPVVSVKTVGQAASRFDESLTRGIAGLFSTALGFFSTRVRTVLQSGYLQNYAFVIFAALIFAAAVLVLLLTYGR